MLQNEEYIESFVEEARTHIEVAENSLIKIDLAAPDKETINSIFRAVHSMKGTAGFFNLNNIVSLSHCMENILGEVRSGKKGISSDMIDVLIGSIDKLKELVEDVLNSEERNIKKCLDSLKKFMDSNETKSFENETPQKEVEVAVQEDIQENSVQEDALTDKLPTLENMCTNLESLVSCTNEINKNLNPIIENENENIKDKLSGTKRSVNVEDSIRVHISLLNNLLNLASEMVLGRNQLIRGMEKHRKLIPGIDSILQNIDHITTELQEKVMQTRMQTVANVFNKFPRLIRDLSKKLGKEIDLKIEGAEVELDKSIIETLADPLTHLIRNAADHGIELPDDRQKAGKPRYGTINMCAYHESGYVNIDIIDDGKGINVEKIKQKAFEKGLIERYDLNGMNEHEALQLLFKPGFSTADEITDVSGRGVGMDVVKNNIDKMGGTIEIFTAIDKGTTFRLLLPLTLAIIPSIIVEVQNQKFALPQVNLQEIVRIKPGDEQRKIEFVNNAEVLRLRGGLLPIVPLADVIELPKVENKNRITRVLVVKIGSKKIGLCVDGIYGSEEILVKPLPLFIKECRCYSGVTIMGDGKIAMILDPEGIIEKANMHFADTLEDKNSIKDDTEEILLREQQSLLIFKCSGEESLAVDLSMVSRVEEIQKEDIEHLGDCEFIKFRGDTLRVIRPEDYLPISRNNASEQKMYVIIPKFLGCSIGIIIRQIEDTIQTRIKFASEGIDSKGIIGATIIGDRIVNLLNVYELFEIVEPEKYNTAQRALESKNRLVLLVEDTPFFMRLEKEYLESHQYKVITAFNGKEALDILEHTQVDIVVSDIQMPIMDGIELVKRIRADDRLKNLPVVAVTSMVSEDQKKFGLESGFDFYDHKIDRARLLDIVGQALKKRSGDSK